MLLRNQPWQIINDLNSVLDGNLGRLRGGDDSRVEGGSWIPAVDIKETADRFVLLVDIPGVNPQDVEISMENNILTLKGAREESKEANEDGYHRVERLKGCFYRRFTLPDTADPENVTAKSRHGVLEVSIHKRKALLARRIQVQSEE